MGDILGMLFLSDEAMSRCVTLHELMPHPALFKIQVVISQSQHELSPSSSNRKPRKRITRIVYLEASVADHVIKLSVVYVFIHHLASCSNDGFEEFSVGFVVVPLRVNRVCSVS